MTEKTEAVLREALSQILWVKDCGIDGVDETGVYRNWPAEERDAMYKIAKQALLDTADPSSGSAAEIRCT